MTRHQLLELRNGLQDYIVDHGRDPECDGNSVRRLEALRQVLSMVEATLMVAGDGDADEFDGAVPV